MNFEFVLVGVSGLAECALCVCSCSIQEVFGLMGNQTILQSVFERPADYQSPLIVLRVSTGARNGDTSLCNNIMVGSLMDVQDVRGLSRLFTSVMDAVRRPTVFHGIKICTQPFLLFVSHDEVENFAVDKPDFTVLVSPRILVQGPSLAGKADMLLMKQLPESFTEQGQRGKLRYDSHTLSSLGWTGYVCTNESVVNDFW